jgi:hypothetical protein
MHHRRLCSRNEVCLPYLASPSLTIRNRCHLGRQMVFDTVNELKWSVDVRTHPILNVIERILDGGDKNEWFKPFENGTVRELPAVEDVDQECLVSLSVMIVMTRC